MTIIIIGGSGMLYNVCEWITKEYSELILLCSRNEEKYNGLLNQSNTQFLSFDFSEENDYTKLLNEIIEEKATILVAWIHSPYYDYFNELIKHQCLNKTKIFLIQGSTSRNYRFDKDIEIIKLGKHKSENRWLTHQEISDLVINRINC